MIVTIDGPAGSGKSTAARELAARLGKPYLDTGAMYRVVAFRALRDGISLEDGGALAAAARASEIEVDCRPTEVRVRLDGQDVSEAIRSLEVSQATSPVARAEAVRAVLIAKQREMGRRLGWLITEGRDQGSVVFPDADVKIFLDASLAERVERRYRELTSKGETVTREEIRRDVTGRDANDEQQWAPLLEESAVVRVNTDGMTIDQVAEVLVEKVRERGPVS